MYELGNISSGFLHRWQQWWWGGNNGGGGNTGGGGNSEGLRFEDLVRLLVSTRGEAALRRRCPFWTTGNVKTIETLFCCHKNYRMKHFHN